MPKKGRAPVKVVSCKEHRERACYGKARFKNLRYAMDTAGAVSKKDGEPFVVYPCPYCHGYHISHAISAMEASLG